MTGHRGQTTRQTGPHKVGHTQLDTVNCTYREHRQPVREWHSGALSTEHTEGSGNQLKKGRLGTANQGHTLGHTGAVYGVSSLAALK